MNKDIGHYPAKTADSFKLGGDFSYVTEICYTQRNLK